MTREQVERLTTKSPIELVRDLIVATTEYTKAVNSNRGTKGKALAERKAAAALLLALTGEKPTQDELDAVTVL